MKILLNSEAQHSNRVTYIIVKTFLLVYLDNWYSNLFFVTEINIL